MKRLIVLAAGLGLAAVTAAPAAAVTVYCFSLDSHCETNFECPPNSTAIHDNGFSDTGPWLVICAPDL